MFWGVILLFSSFPLLIIIEVPSIICLMMAYSKSSYLNKKAQKDLKFYIWITIFKSFLCTFWTLYIYIYHMEAQAPGDESPAQWHNSGVYVGITCFFELIYFITATFIIVRMTSKLIKNFSEPEVELNISAYNPL